MEGGFTAHIRGGSRRGGSDRHSDGNADVGFGNAAVSLATRWKLVELEARRSGFH